MEPQNFFQVCVFFAIGLMVFTMSLSFVEEIGVFGAITPSGGLQTNLSGNPNDITKNFTENPTSEENSGFGNVFTLVFGLGTIVAIGGALAIAIATQNATFVGVYIFSIYFWASYINALSVLSIGSFLPVAFITLFTVPIGFIFVGAVIGMLSGV